MGIGTSYTRSISEQSDSSMDESQLLNEDLFVEILARVPAKDLLTSCSLVCKQWYELIRGHSVWKQKCLMEGKSIPPYKFEVIPLHYYRFIFLRNPYGRNLLRNPCGEDSFEHWNITQSGGNEWTVENPPQGADPVPAEVGSQSCFATSYYLCEKAQEIDLFAEGILQEVIEKIHPAIQIGEWHASRFDCGTKYDLTVVLKDAEGNELRTLDFGPIKEDQWFGKSWTKLSESITDYPAGLRYIMFIHSGIDTQFWAGHYGSKMTGAYVKLKIT